MTAGSKSAKGHTEVGGVVVREVSVPSLVRFLGAQVPGLRQTQSREVDLLLQAFLPPDPSHALAVGEHPFLATQDQPNPAVAEARRGQGHAQHALAFTDFIGMETPNGTDPRFLVEGGSGPVEVAGQCGRASHSLVREAPHGLPPSIFPEESPSRVF